VPATSAQAEMVFSEAGEMLQEDRCWLLLWSFKTLMVTFSVYYSVGVSLINMEWTSEFCVQTAPFSNVF